MNDGPARYVGLLWDGKEVYLDVGGHYPSLREAEDAMERNDAGLLVFTDREALQLARALIETALASPVPGPARYIVAIPPP